MPCHAVVGNKILRFVSLPFSTQTCQSRAVTVSQQSMLLVIRFVKWEKKEIVGRTLLRQTAPSPTHNSPQLLMYHN